MKARKKVNAKKLIDKVVDNVVDSCETIENMLRKNDSEAHKMIGKVVDGVVGSYDEMVRVNDSRNSMLSIRPSSVSIISSFLLQGKTIVMITLKEGMNFRLEFDTQPLADAELAKLVTK